jgi:HK97 family phage portal protein
VGLLDRFLSWTGDSDPVAPVAPAAVAPRYDVQAYDSLDLARDLGVPEFFRYGNASGARINRRTILRNAAVARCVFLISNSIGMLPLHLLQRGDNSGDVVKATGHPLYAVLAQKPNGWQTPFEFRRLMQHRALTDGNAYALPIRGARNQVVALIPLPCDHVRVEQREDWSVVYHVRRGKYGGETPYPSQDMFHLRGPSEDGIKGLALTDYAAEVLGLALRAQEAAARIFAQGVMAGGALKTDQKLSPEAIANIKTSMQENFGGAENNGKWMVLEQGLEAQPFASTAKDAQNVETRAHQIEEVARIFGVPRPFLMVDDTSWGSGIEQLGIFFVQYGLAPWFKAWEDAIGLTLLTPEETRGGYYAKFNERALLRGSMKDQAEFFSKMMGAGGGPQIMEQNEARALLDLPEHVDGGGLSKGSQAKGPADGTTGQD